MVDISVAKGIVGWMSDEELTFLAETASKSKLIIEAGSFQGRSTRAMADNTTGIIHAVDPWKPMPLTKEAGIDSMTYSRFVANMGKHYVSQRVIPHGMEFKHFWLERPDFVFIDAMHDYNSCFGDILHALELMQVGILAGHDYHPIHWPGVVKAVDELFGKDKVKIVDTIWHLEIK